MISIIICSRQPDISDELKENIATTVGCEYELVVIDNSHNQYSIFAAYNEGVRRAKGDVLCFMHEDIIFHSKNWGKIVTDFYQIHPDFGILGIIGGHVLPDTPTSYWESGLICGRYIQGFYENGIYKTRIDEPSWTDSFKECAAVDGLWMCAPATLFKLGKLKWDINTYNFFHCYDLDICMQSLVNGYKVGVINNIIIEHLSCGNTDGKYQEQNLLWYNKWKEKLPIVCGCYIDDKELELRTQLVKIRREALTVQNQLSSQLNNIRNSHAYNLGRRLLSPIKWILHN